MTKASDNIFPKVLIVEGSAPSAPGAGDQVLYIDSADHKLKRKNSSNAVTTIEGGGIEVKEADGTPDVTGVTIIRVSNGTLTDNGGGDVSITTGGGGGATLGYVGYNTVGGSAEVMTDKRWYLKKVTTTGAVQLLSIGAHIQWGVDGLGALGVAVFEDNAGTAGKVLAGNLSFGPTASSAAFDLSEAAGTRNYRWFDLPIAQELAASTSYWLGFVAHADATQPSIHYDGSGSDVYYTGTIYVLSDAPYFTNNATTNKYSIRGRVIS